VQQATPQRRLGAHRRPHLGGRRDGDRAQDHEEEERDEGLRGERRHLLQEGPGDRRVDAHLRVDAYPDLEARHVVDGVLQLQGDVVGGAGRRHAHRPVDRGEPWDPVTRLEQGPLTRKLKANLTGACA